MSKVNDINKILHELTKLVKENEKKYKVEVAKANRKLENIKTITLSVKESCNSLKDDIKYLRDYSEQAKKGLDSPSNEIMSNKLDSALHYLDYMERALNSIDMN
jgi:predicted  nucleic acid-binding Zn-ribbon protein